MSKTQLAMILVCAAAVGCQDRLTDGTEVVAVENNDLGISQVEIQHGFLHGDRVLTIRAIDQSEREIAITLRTGQVSYTPEPGLIAPGWSEGTELTVSVGDEHFDEITPDLLAHQVRYPLSTGIATFVRLGAVAAAVKNEAGLWFAAPRQASDGEVAFSATTCNGANFPSAKGNPQECCQDGTTTYHKIANVAANSPNQNLLGVRTYAGGSCRPSSGYPGLCGDPGSSYGQCTFGPCGGTLGSVSGVTGAAVFVPVSAPTVCGRDDNGIASGGTWYPEEFARGATKYAAVTASCTYAHCCPNDDTGMSEAYVGTCPGLLGASCSADSQCMTNQCNTTTGVCVSATCSTQGCDAYTHCCDGLCFDGACQ